MPMNVTPIPTVDERTDDLRLRTAVHKILIAENVLGRYASGESWDFGN